MGSHWGRSRVRGPIGDPRVGVPIGPLLGQGFPWGPPLVRASWALGLWDPPRLLGPWDPPRLLGLWDPPWPLGLGFPSGGLWV